GRGIAGLSLAGSNSTVLALLVRAVIGIRRGRQQQDDHCAAHDRIVRAGRSRCKFAAMMRAMRQVRGVLLVDYVRMLRSQKSVDWSRHLEPQDLQYLETHIDPAGWYPMATFERMG